jgi:hypothetical protein
MASLPRKIADPLQFLSVQPFCAYPHMAKLILSLNLDQDEQDKLLAELHRFEHTLLAAGYQLYSAVSRATGAKVLDGALSVFAEEYPKWVASQKKAK